MINFACACAVLADIWYNYYCREQTEVIFFHGRRPHCDLHRQKPSALSSLNRDCPMCKIYKIIGWLNETKKTLDICMYSLSNDLLTDAIINVHKRGVRVRIIVNEDNITSTWKLGSMGIAKKVKPMQYNEDMLMHHKFIIIDDKKVILGSMNWTVKAVRVNWENVFLTNQWQIVDPFRQEFKILWTQFDQQICKYY